MFGRFGWAEILVIVVLVLILFGHNKIPGMMKNLADGINTFKKELKDTSKKDTKKSSGAVASNDATSAKKTGKKSSGAGKRRGVAASGGKAKKTGQGTAKK